jgi:hypothetical protein
MFKVQVIVYKLVRVCCRFCWTFWIFWTCFADGNNFNLPTPKIVNAFEAGDSRKAVTILDMVAWIAQNPGTTYTKQNQDTGYFNRKYIRTRRPEAAGDVKLTSLTTIERFVMLMFFNKAAHGNDARARILFNEVRANFFLAIIIIISQLLEQLWLILFKQKEEWN